MGKGFAMFATNDNKWLFTVDEWDALTLDDQRAIARARRGRCG